MAQRSSSSSFSNHLQYFLLASIALHLFLSIVMTQPMLHRLFKYAAPPMKAPPPPSLTILKMEPHPKPPIQFVPTLPSQQVAQVDPNAILESERNTALQSELAGKVPNSPLPTLGGASRAGLIYHDTAASPMVRSTPSPQAEQTPPAPTPPPPPPPKPKAAQTPPPPPIDRNALPILPPLPPEIKTPAKAPEQKQQERETPIPPTAAVQSIWSPPQTQSQSQPSKAAPPASLPSVSQQMSQISGGLTPSFGAPSPASKETDIGRYKARLYKTIGSRWYVSVDRNMTVLAIGEVHIKFFVRSNGVIDDKSIAVTGESGRTDILRTISLKAVQESYGEPFPESMKQQLGDGYWEEITFTIY